MTVQISTRSKDAIKTALAMSIAYGLALSMNWEKPMWAGFAVAFVSLATVGHSLNKAAMRMLGTLIAALVALALIAAFAQLRWMFILALSSYIGICTYMMGGTRHQYFWNVCGFVCIIIALEAGNSSGDAFMTALQTPNCQRPGTLPRARNRSGFCRIRIVWRRPRGSWSYSGLRSVV